MKFIELPISRLTVGRLVLFSRMWSHHARRSFKDKRAAWHQAQARDIEARHAGLVVPIFATVLHINKHNRKKQ